MFRLFKKRVPRPGHEWRRLEVWVSPEGDLVPISGEHNGFRSPAHVEHFEGLYRIEERMLRSHCDLCERARHTRKVDFFKDAEGNTFYNADHEPYEKYTLHVTTDGVFYSIRCDQVPGYIYGGTNLTKGLAHFEEQTEMLERLNAGV